MKSSVKNVGSRMLRVGGSAALLSGAAWCITAAAASTAASAATSAPYELYCPGTPVGDIILNNATTSGTITPANPAPGSTFNITGYQTIVNVPFALVTASAALGNSDLAGSASVGINATSATPATLPSPAISFTVPIPSPVPMTGVTLDLPAAPSTVGPFTAGSGAITITQSTKASLTLTVSGNPLALTCTSYKNNSGPTGITMTPPPSSDAASPVITTATSSGPATTTPTTAAPVVQSTTPTTAPTGSGLAYTGAGPDLYLLGFTGVVLLMGSAMLLLFDKTRRVFVRVLHRGSTPPQ